MNVGKLCLFIWGASLLVACGGGAGSSALSPTLSPGKGPGSADAAATYAQTVTYDGAPLTGLVCQSPEYPLGIAHTWTGAISQSSSVNQTFNGQGGLVAVKSSVTLQGCAPTAFADGTEPVNETDYFEQLPPRSPDEMSQTVLIGSTMQWTDIFGNEQTLNATYDNAGLIVEERPFQVGRTWSSSARRTITRAHETVTVNADGSYTDASVETGDTVFPYDSVTTVENSDASGSRTEITQVEGESTPGPAYGLTLSAPSGNTVTITPFGTAPVDPVVPPPIPSPCATPGGTPCPAVTPTPYTQYAWYPYVPTAAHPLETIRSIDKGSAALPESCNISDAFAKSAELIETVDTTLDVWTGTTTSTTDAYVDAHDGVLCANVTVQWAYYVFGSTSADTTPASRFTLSFTDALQSQTSPPPVFAVPALARYVTLWR